MSKAIVGEQRSWIGDIHFNGTGEVKLPGSDIPAPTADDQLLDVRALYAMACSRSDPIMSGVLRLLNEAKVFAKAMEKELEKARTELQKKA